MTVYNTSPLWGEQRLTHADALADSFWVVQSLKSLVSTISSFMIWLLTSVSLSAAQITSYELTVSPSQIPPMSYQRLSRATVYSAEDFPGDNAPYIQLSGQL